VVHPVKGDGVDGGPKRGRSRRSGFASDSFPDRSGPKGPVSVQETAESQKTDSRGALVLLKTMVIDTPDVGLPELAGTLEEARACVAVRLASVMCRCEKAAAVSDRLLTMEEVAGILGVSEELAREMGRRGEIPTIPVGERFVRVRFAALMEWIRVREQGNVGPIQRMSR
jgi:excisionase family DNA binding protein